MIGETEGPKLGKFGKPGLGQGRRTALWSREATGAKRQAATLEKSWGGGWQCQSKDIHLRDVGSAGAERVGGPDAVAEAEEVEDEDAHPRLDALPPPPPPSQHAAAAVTPVTPETHRPTPVSALG